jgi:transglutaminase-like putative cysteine protease
MLPYQRRDGPVKTVSDDFLALSARCDWDRPSIQNIVLNICNSCESQKAAAAAIYYFVRDEIPFGFRSLRETASETLKWRQGQCAHKANLQIAMLRCLNIPAGYRNQSLDARAYEGFISDHAAEFLGDPLAHVYATAFLDGKWVGADATLDAALLDLVTDEPWRMRGGWDGQTDITFPEEFLIGEPSDPFAEMDWESTMLDIPQPRLFMLNQRLVEIRGNEIG